MPPWVVNVLFRQCVSVCGTPVGLVAHVGAAILVTGLSDLVGSSMVCSEWLSLMSRWACGYGVIKLARAESPSSAPVYSGSCIKVTR